MPKIQVYHMRRGEHGQPIVSNGCEMFDKVATVHVPDDIGGTIGALDYAWRWTNNIDGSWVGGELDNPDFNPLVESHVYGDGCRSSMVGDVFGVGTVSYTVASCGFERVR